MRWAVPAETKELIAGFWIVQGKSQDEVDVEDFGENITPELRERIEADW